MRADGKASERRAGAAALALCMLAAFSCTRDYDSPYVPGSGSYAGPEWTEDGDGDGVADSVAKYAPDCDKPPRECLEVARTVSRIGDNYRLDAVDMILWRDAPGVPPRLTWSPASASVLGVALHSSDTAKVRVRGGLLEPVGEGSVQVTATVPSGSRAVSFLVKVVAEGKPAAGISAGDLVLRAGEEAPPSLAWNPPDAAHREYILSIDSPHVATVSGGRLKAIFPGKARVVVEALDGGHRGAFTLTVEDFPQRVEASAALVEDMYLVAGAREEAPTVHWSPASVTHKAWLLAPVNPEVAGVSKEGNRIVPLMPGRTDVTFYSLDGSGLRAAFTVHVTDRTVPVQGVAAADLKLTPGGEPTPPRLVWTPAEATDRRYALTTDNPSVADVAGNLVVPRDTGTATLTVVTRDGAFPASFRVEVALPDSAIRVDSLGASDMTLTVGSRRRPALDWVPANAFNRSYSLVSSDPSVAAADGESVHAVAQGSADFTVLTADGGRQATFRVAVVGILVQRVTAEDLSLVAGAEAGPSLSFAPGDATDLSYTLRSLDPAIVAVTPDSAALRGVQVGSAKVVVRSKDGPLDTLVATVLARPIPVTRMDMPAITLNVGDPSDRDVAPSIVWEPAYATNKGFQLVSSSNPSAVVIVENRLRALAAGESRVVLQSLDAAGLRDTFTVTARIPVRSLAVRDTSVWLGTGDLDPSRLVTWTPADATNKGFTLQSLDTAVAKALPDNRIRPGQGGTARLVMRSAENPARIDTFKVTVKIHVKSITVLRDTTVWVGMTKVDIAPLLAWSPANASEKWWWLEWVGTSNTAVVQKNDTWAFDAKGPGQVKMAVIYAHLHNIRDTLTITVKQAVQSIAVLDATLKVGDPDLTPTVTITPSNASDKGYSLTSSAPGVASIVGGRIHAVGPGTATVTARTNEGGKTDAFTVTVVQPVRGISVANDEMRMGDPDLFPTIQWTPPDATNRSVTMVSSDPDVAAIVNGRIRAVSRGRCTITVTAVDGGFKDAFTLEVRAAPPPPP